MKSRPKHHGAGFTLVELLVVLAVISLLIAILLSATRRARIPAQRVYCASQMRQIGIAFRVYSETNKGIFPASGNTLMPDDWIHWSAGRDLQQSAIAKCLGGRFQPNLFTCPQDPRPLAKVSYPYSYCVNGSLVSSQVINRRVSRIVHASQIILLIELHPRDINGPLWGSGTFSERPEPGQMLSIRHDIPADPYRAQGRGNVIFCDTHHEFFPRNLCNTRPYAYPLGP
jgi:prepilin-type N-terminal cleavage/methylation domain-containing protein